MARDLWPLTAKQAPVMKLLSEGFRPKEVAARLELHIDTVYARSERAAARVGCTTVIAAIRKLAERGYFKE
jgi:DNA-binding CsgD family transcriptional regulator